MRIALAVVALLLLAGCGEDGGGDVVQDPGLQPATNRMPTEVPAADGPVRTRSIATVMDTVIDTGQPELCLGPVAESYPPQCGGPPMAGWVWADHRGGFEQVGDVRWGTFAVTGTFDGTTFTVTDAIPAALYDPAAPSAVPLPAPARDYTAEELASIAERAGSELPGAQGAYASERGQVHVDVVYDDGSLQSWADREWGAGVVVVSSALVR